MRALHVVLHILDAGELVLRLIVFELCLKTQLPVVVPVKGIALAVLAPGIKGNEL